MTDRPAILSTVQPEWLRRKERGSAFAIRAIVSLSLSLGRPFARLFLPLGCLYFLVFAPASRRASTGYLARALGRPATLADVFRQYFAFASCILDRVFFLSNRLDQFDIRISGEPALLDVLATGTGCILLGAHMGSFEALRSIGRGRSDLGVKMMMFEENAQKITSVLNAINPELAKDVISLGKPASIITVRECLEAGELVGMLVDRSLSDGRQSAHPFLGAPARFSVNPFRMIAILKIPVVLMFGLYRGGNRYDIHFEPFSMPDQTARRPTTDEIDQTVGRYVARLEHYCRIAPYNWFNFYDIWK
ncbi:MAG: acyl-CoA synthetase [Rhodospirillales bacterium]|nr:acyl-CoA synthetase [Rhodospirillales bacterium]